MPELTNREIREAFLALAQAVTTEMNFNMVPWVKSVENTMSFRLKQFVRYNPPICLGSKVNEDPHEFLDGVYKVLSDMGFTSREKAELDSCQLRDVSKILYTQ